MALILTLPRNIFLPVYPIGRYTTLLPSLHTTTTTTTTPHHTTPHHTTLRSDSFCCVRHQGVEMAKKLNAAAFVEVSAVNNVNIQEAVREAVYLSIFYLANEIKTKKKSKETACLLQ